MPILYTPFVGQILTCDFSDFKAPEMVKKRPVIVLATRHKSESLVTVICLSTKEPTPFKNHHLKLDQSLFPKHKLFDGKESWLKGDMIYTVGFHRLEQIKLGFSHGKRSYFKTRLPQQTMKAVQSCVLHGLNLGFLSDHL